MQTFTIKQPLAEGGLDLELRASGRLRDDAVPLFKAADESQRSGRFGTTGSSVRPLASHT